MNRALLIGSLMLLTSTGALAGDELRHDRQELRHDRAEQRDDRRDHAYLLSLDREFDRAVHRRDRRLLEDVERDLRRYIDAAVAESRHELRHDWREVRRSEWERRGWRDDSHESVWAARRYRMAKLHDRRDDTRDLRDDRRDARREREALEQLYRISDEFSRLAGNVRPWALNKKQQLIDRLVSLERQELEENRRELREDRRERREDRRDLRQPGRGA